MDMNLLHNNPTITKRPSSYVYENPDLGTYSRIVYVNTQSVNIQDIEGLSDSAKIFHLSAPHKIERAYRSCIELARLIATDEVATVTPESANRCCVLGYSQDGRLLSLVASRSCVRSLEEETFTVGQNSAPMSSRLTISHLSAIGQDRAWISSSYQRPAWDGS